MVSDAKMEKGASQPAARVDIFPRSLLVTKLGPSPVARGLVARSELLARLKASARYKLVLLGAPAGWGKTTLLHQWRATFSDERRFAWLSIDAADNDPVRFWTYVIQAIKSADATIGTEALDSLGSPGTTVREHVLPPLINDLAALSEQIVLVLDDFHVITQNEVHESVALLVERLPPSVQLVLSTRSDPPLPLPRLRVHQEIQEIRAQQLRFSRRDAANLLNGVLQLGLSEGEVDAIQDRTEGWAAGIYLAALSLRSSQDPAGFIAEFAGDDRHVVDFLATEVLDGLPPQMRNFLLQTSILERLCGPLCDWVTGSDSSEGVLAEIEHSNLFVVPLDNKRRWYRYHHLFRELLCHELRRSQPDVISKLHRRASAWHREHGSPSVAIRHAIAGSDIEAVSELITRHWYDYLQRGRVETVVRWIDALGNEAVESDPRLCLTKAWLGINTGQLDEIDHWIAVAEEALPALADRDHAMIESGAANLRAIHRYMQGDMGEAIEAGRRAMYLERTGPGSPWHPAGCPVLGVGLFWSGHADEAERELTAAVREAKIGGNNLSEIHALGGLAAISADRGDVAEAGRRSTTALEKAERHGLGEHWATSLAYSVRAQWLQWDARPAEALDATVRAVELSQRGIASAEIAYALVARARLERDKDAARSLAVAARRTVERCPDPGVLTGLVESTERSVRGPRRRPGMPASVSGELSEREWAVLRLLPTRLSQRQIAEELYVSLNTVKTHVRSIFRKLNASHRAEAVDRAHERGLL